MITQEHDAITIRGAATLAAVYRSVLLGIRQQRADGLPARDLQELARELYRAHTIAVSRPRRELGAAVASASRSNSQDSSDLISVGEASALLGISRRQVQRMAADRSRGGLEAIRVGRTWALRKAPVLALAEQRKAAK